MTNLLEQFERERDEAYLKVRRSIPPAKISRHYPWRTWHRDQVRLLRIDTAMRTWSTRWWESRGFTVIDLGDGSFRAEENEP